MKKLISLVKNNYTSLLPLASVFIIMVVIVVGQKRYWPLQPLWQTYLAIFFVQFSFWLLLMVWNKNKFSDNILKTRWTLKNAFIIGFFWSVIQIFWLKQWWTWLNLISQPFVFVLVGYILINIFNFTLDQFNKIRHHNDAKYEIEKE